MRLPKKIADPYKGVAGIFRRYWCAYGGFGVILFSPYAHVAILLTIALSRYWLEREWWDTALSVIPNILGFTLAGFTIWLGFGDDRFQRRVSTRRPGRHTSPYMGVSAGFVHFIVIQLAAAISALIAKATNFSLAGDHPLQPLVSWVAPIGHSIGFFLFVYSLMTAQAATMGVFRTASWFEHDRLSRDKTGGEQPSGQSQQGPKE